MQIEFGPVLLAINLLAFFILNLTLNVSSICPFYCFSNAINYPLCGIFLNIPIYKRVFRFLNLFSDMINFKMWIIFS